MKRHVEKARGPQRLLSVAEAAAYLGISKPLFYRLGVALKFNRVTIGVRSERYDVRDLDAWIDAEKERQAHG